jgi:hypothetical protein
VNRPLSELVVHCKRSLHDVYIGRPSIWGNPLVVGRDGTRHEVCEKYEAYLLRDRHLLARLPELRGKVLGCWCAPKECHGMILARYANDPEFWPVVVRLLRELSTE